MVCPKRIRAVLSTLAKISTGLRAFEKFFRTHVPVPGRCRLWTPFIVPTVPSAPEARPALMKWSAAAQKSGVPIPGIQAYVGALEQDGAPHDEAAARWYAVPPGPLTIHALPDWGNTESQAHGSGVSAMPTGLSTGTPWISPSL